MNDLNDTLKRQATELKACRKVMRNWNDSATPQELINLWKNNMDFVVAHKDFPTVTFMKFNFDGKLLADNQIYVDAQICLRNAPNGVYVLCGECSGTLHFSQWAAATVYVRHNSHVSIIAEDFAKVFVRVYDEAEADIVEVGDAVVKVYDRRD